MEPWKGCGLFIVILVILSRKYFILLYDSWIPSILQISLKTLWNLIEFKGPEVFWQSGLSKSHAIKRFQVTSINWKIRWYTIQIDVWVVFSISHPSTKYTYNTENTPRKTSSISTSYIVVYICVCVNVSVCRHGTHFKFFFFLSQLH